MHRGSRVARPFFTGTLGRWRKKSKGEMTVSYTLEVADARFGGFSKLLFRWKGSIYRLLYKDLLAFCAVYLFFSLFYR